LNVVVGRCFDAFDDIGVSGTKGVVPIWIVFSLLREAPAMCTPSTSFGAARQSSNA
jgi:hypothetical protein